MDTTAFIYELNTYTIVNELFSGPESFLDTEVHGRAQPSIHLNLPDADALPRPQTEGTRLSEPQISFYDCR